MARKCLAYDLGCRCADQEGHNLWIAEHTEKVKGTELVEGDVVFIAHSWIPLTDLVITDNGSLRATTPRGETMGSSTSLYSRFVG